MIRLFRTETALKSLQIYKVLVYIISLLKPLKIDFRRK